MGLKERREREKTDIRDKIIDAARTLFAKEGFEAVSMRKIADTIEYSPTAIYVHFKDKQSLLRELCGRDFCALAEAFAHIAGMKDPVEKIWEIGRAYARFGIEHPNHYRMMFMTALEHQALTPEEEARCGKPDQDGYAFLKGAVAEAISSGAFRPGLTDPALVAQTLWAGVHGVVSLHIAKADDPWIKWAKLEKRVETMLEAMMHGLLNPSKKGGGR